MYAQDLAGCGGQALPPRLEAELYSARLQLVIVSPVFLQWVYRNPALLVGRLLQQDRSVHPRKHIAAMLSIIDNTLDNQPSPHQIKIYVLNIYPFFRDKHPSAHKSHPLFAQNPCVSQYHPIARNNPLFICNNHPSVAPVWSQHSPSARTTDPACAG